MSDAITADFDTSGLNRLTEELHDALIGQGGDAQMLFENQAKLFLQQVITLTPPTRKAKEVNDEGQITADSQSAKERGEAAIDKDMGHIFTGINEDFLDDLVIEHGATKIDEWITSAGGDRKHIQFDYADNTGNVMAEHHNRNRNSKGRTYNLMRSKQGVWYSPFVVSFENYKRYADKVKSHLGRRKAGWAVSFRQLGGKVPSWIARHIGGSRGEYHNAKNPEKPSIILINRAPGLSADGPLIRSAMRIRMQATKRRIKLILSGYADAKRRGSKITRMEKPVTLQEAA